MAIVKHRTSSSADESQTEEISASASSENVSAESESAENAAAEKPKRRRVVRKVSVAPTEEEAKTDATSVTTPESTADAAQESPAEENTSETPAPHYQNRRYTNTGGSRFTNSNRRYNNYRNGNYDRNAQARLEAAEASQHIENPEEYESKPRLLINDLTKMGMHELRDLAIQYGISADDLAPMKKQDLIFTILKAHTEHGGIIFASGALEILPDGYGFLRSPQNSYLPGPDDIYISPSQIRLFNLKTGDTIYGQTRSPKDGERFFALLRIETVNFDDPRVAQTRIPFENLTPLYPN